MNELIEGDGYAIYDRFIPVDLIDNVANRLDTLYPVRASSIEKHYAEGDDIKNLPDIAVWWSQTVHEWLDVQNIIKVLDPIIKTYSDKLEFYASDIVNINPGSGWINPHVDTPHRFHEYTEDERLLGIQCIVALQDITYESGTTGVVPGSQKQNWNIDKCYAGAYTHYFMDNYIQNDLSKGSVLLYNCRILHSSMPNYSPKIRPALLINYINSDIIEEVKNIDNIWRSNDG